MSTENEEIKIGGEELELSNLEKVYFPDEKPARPNDSGRSGGFTKGDVIEYYRLVSKVILPYLRDRPENLNRHPNGIKGDSFYQKDVDHQGPNWVRTIGIHSESNNKTVRYLICDDEKTLVYMANLGCIEINPWHSRVGSIGHPDYCLIDLDPQVKDFDIVVEVAQVTGEILEKAGAKSFIKTTGKRGLHILIPLGAQYTYEQSRQFAEVVVGLVHEQLPKTTSLERSPSKRRGKVYLDYLQNGKGQTMAAPYCLRPIEGLRVSTPLEWKEIKPSLNPADYTVRNIHKRLEKHGDLLRGLLGKGIDMEKVLNKLAK